MAVYICNICGEKHECDERPGECMVCGSQDFRIEGEHMPQSENCQGMDARDIDRLFSKHNMVYPPVKAENDKKERLEFEAAARRQAQERSDAAARTANKFKEFRYPTVSFLCVLGWVASFSSCPFTMTPFPWIISSVIVGVIWLINRKTYFKYLQNITEDSQRILADCEDDIARYNNEQAGKYKAYCDEFERTSQKLSEDYVGTEFVMQIAEWIFEPFDRKIREADREERIAAIKVEHSYSVYADRIACSNGTYDFRGHGLRDVDDPICQTALSIAIAAAVKILIMQKYPQEPSGTPITISAEISYYKDYPTETMTYTAKNGNHNAASVW